MGNRYNAGSVLKKLKSMADAEALEGMARYGIDTNGALGVSLAQLRRFANELGKDHELAEKLWDSGIREGRILAGLTEKLDAVSEEQIDAWVLGFNSWDVCDLVCNFVFARTRWAWKKAERWSRREEEFVKRAGFVLMACLAVHDKEAPDEKFERLFVHIKRECIDERNFVKKAVNWALRQIGKRNVRLNKKAVKIAGEIQKVDSKVARWIASDALRELTSEKAVKRLRS